MHRYETLGVLGEGAYGIVMKCRHKETRQLVAVKKFMEPEEDPSVRKIALREVKMLKLLRHENLIGLLEVFKKKKHYYLVFEYVDHTVLDELEDSPNGLPENQGKGIIWQVIQGIRFCHLNGVVHRDVKPENVLISQRGVVKLCDFGFARKMAAPGEAYTDYVATRWYRAPELLVGDNMYNESVDVWSIGCLLVELLSGDPLFPGDSDIDQIYHITKCLGNLITYHRELFNTNYLFRGLRMPIIRRINSIEQRFPGLPSLAVDFIRNCLNLDPRSRPGCDHIMNHNYFSSGSFRDSFLQHLTAQVKLEYKDNLLLQRLGVTVYGSAFRQFPPSPIPEVDTPEESLSPPPKKEVNRAATKRKLNRSSQMLPAEISQSDFNPIERLLKELQVEALLNQELEPNSTHLPHETLQHFTKEPTHRTAVYGHVEKEQNLPVKKNIRSPIRRKTPEQVTADTCYSPKRTSIQKVTRSSVEPSSEPQQASMLKRKQDNSHTSNGTKNGTPFLPNLVPKGRQQFKTQFRALPNPETILATRKWNERQQPCLTKISEPPKLQHSIPQLAAIDNIPYFPHNDSDESFIV